MFDFVRDIIDDGDEWDIESIMKEMKSLISDCEERLEELKKGE